MNERHQNHYDAHCPRCRRANSISRQRMELFYPNWQEAAKQMASAPVTPPASPPPTPASAMLKTEPISKAKKAEAGKVLAKPSATKKAPAAKKPAAKKASSEKPAAKKSPAKGKKK